MSLAAQVVDWGALGKVVAASLIAGTAVPGAFSLTIYGSARFVELRRSDRGATAAAFAVLAVVSLAVVAAAVVFGISAVLKK